MFCFILLYFSNKCAQKWRAVHTYITTFITVIYTNLPNYRSRVGTSIIFQSYSDCIETRLKCYSSFKGLRICICLLLYNIYLFDKYILYSSKSEYICSKDGTFTRWRHHISKRLHNPIRIFTRFVVRYDVVWVLCREARAGLTRWCVVAVQSASMTVHSKIHSLGWLVGFESFTFWQHLVSYQNGHRLVTVYTQEC